MEREEGRRDRRTKAERESRKDKGKISGEKSGRQTD